MRRLATSLRRGLLIALLLLTALPPSPPPAHALSAPISRALAGNIQTPLLDLVPVSSAAGAAYSMWRLRSGYAGAVGQMRNLEGAVYVYRDLPFVRGKGQYIADVAAYTAFDALKDPGTYTEFRFYDQSGNGNDTAFSGTHLGLLMSIGPYGQLYAGVNHATNSPVANAPAIALPAAIALNMDAMTQVVVAQLTTSSPSPSSTLVELVNASAQRSPWFVRSPTNGGFAHVFGGFATNRNFGLQRSGPSLFTLNSGAAFITMSTDGLAPVAVAKGTAGYNSQGGWIGWSQSGSGSDGGVDFQALVFYNRSLTPTEQSLVNSWYYPINPLAFGGTSTLITIGDSQTQGNGNTYNSSMWDISMQPLLGRPYNFTGAGVSGTSYTQHNAVVSRYTALYRTGGENVVFLMSLDGSELIDNGGNVANALAAMKTLVSNLRAGAGGATVKVVAVAQAKFNPAVLAQATQAAFWAALDADHAFLDGYANIATDPHLGASGNLSDTVYYQSDMQHLTAYGQQYLAQTYGAPVMNSLH